MAIEAPSPVATGVGSREMPVSRYDLDTYWGRVLHAANVSDPRYVDVVP